MGHLAGQELGEGHPAHPGLLHQPLPFLPLVLVTFVLQVVATLKKQHWARRQDPWVPVAARPLSSPQCGGQTCLALGLVSSPAKQG